MSVGVGALNSDINVYNLPPDESPKLNPRLCIESSTSEPFNLHEGTAGCRWVVFETLV